MDLLYYESPPGVQMLHAIDNSTLGGENIFCDSFLAAEHVRQVDPTAYSALTKIPITFHYDNNNEYYYYKRPLIIEDMAITGDFPKIHAINYSPPFQGPFEIGITKEDPAYEMFDNFIRGFQLFENFINDPANHYEVKMKEGTCVFSKIVVYYIRGMSFPIQMEATVGWWVPMLMEIVYGQNYV